MFLKTLLFIIVLYFLIRFVSNMFLPARNKKKSNVRFFYRTFKNVRDHQKNYERQQKQNQKPEEHLDEIEEAEYEDVSDEGNSSDPDKNK